MLLLLMRGTKLSRFGRVPHPTPTHAWMHTYIHIYAHTNIQLPHPSGELPEHAKINETDTYGDGGEGDVGFEFDEERDESSEEGGNAGDIAIDDI